MTVMAGLVPAIHVVLRGGTVEIVPSRIIDRILYRLWGRILHIETAPTRVLKSLIVYLSEYCLKLGDVRVTEFVALGPEKISEPSSGFLVRELRDFAH